MRYIKIHDPVLLEQLYVKVTCLHCQKQYSFHMKHNPQHKTCPCARATFYIQISPYKNWIGFDVLWIGPFERHEDIEVDAIEIAKKEDVPLFEWEDINDDRGEPEE